MRYIVAIVIVAVLVGCVSLAANQSGNALQKRMRQRLVDAQAAGQIPADVDLNNGDYTDFGGEVSDSDLLQLSMLDCWYAYRIILIPVLLAIGLVVAHYCKSAKQNGNSMAPVDSRTAESSN
jgi:hypothetical protein